MKTLKFKGWKLNRRGILHHPLHQDINVRDGKEYKRSFCGHTYCVSRIVWCMVNQVTEVPKGYEVHHINLIHSDNDPKNLVALPKAAHIEAHKIFRECFITAYNNRQIKKPYKKYDDFIAQWQ